MTSGDKPCQAGVPCEAGIPVRRAREALERGELPPPARSGVEEHQSMEGPIRVTVSKRIVWYETLMLFGIILFIWCDEVFDIPYLFLGAPPSPVNWEESLFESVCIGIFGAALIGVTHKLFKRLKYLEGILPVCASCKKIRDEAGHWQHIEHFIRERSAAEFSHGICPECAEKLYPGFNPYKKHKPDQPL